MSFCITIGIRISSEVEIAFETDCWVHIFTAIALLWGPTQSSIATFLSTCLSRTDQPLDTRRKDRTQKWSNGKHQGGRSHLRHHERLKPVRKATLQWPDHQRRPQWRQSSANSLIRFVLESESDPRLAAFETAGLDYLIELVMQESRGIPTCALESSVFRIYVVYWVD